jgi:Cu(I)/Ag(I) efflux system membrane fusion protein
MTPTPDATPIEQERPKRTAGLVLRAVQVRLRFVAVLAVTFLVVGRWDAIRNRWDRLTRSSRSEDAQAKAISSDTEYFCPMDPGVVSDWPGKCGACNMALVRRQRGDATPLPSGVVARMQLSPYRIQLAGIRTAPAEYKPLAREIVLIGTVSGDGGSTRPIEADAFERDIPLLATGQRAEVVAEGLSPLTATIREVRTDPPRVRLEADDPARTLRPGSRAIARVRKPVADLEPFRSLPADPPPLRKGEPRTVYTCPSHADVLAEKPGKCPIDGKDALEPRPLLANQRLGWWCPMHPHMTADRPGMTCKECNGMTLVPRVVTYRPAGQVLAVPESAVVQTGTRAVVFVERMPGMFDGVEVTLGPRTGDSYPVISGLEPGQRIATAGAFLLDAETRLNPSLAAGYFGAARGRAEDVAASTPASVKGTCPVTGKPLGSMGPPVTVNVAGRSVMLCCKGCEDAVRQSPEKYLAP